MTYIIDTSTWITLVKYYKPFDNSSTIYDFFRQKVLNGDFIVLTEVSIECSYVAKKIVINELDFITDKKIITKTTDLIPTKAFYNMLDNQFCNQLQKKRLDEIEIESLTNKYLKDADSKIILKAIQYKKSKEDICIVTEETSANNDNKLFKKIPAICSILDIDCIGLPELMENYNSEISILIKNTSS